MGLMDKNSNDNTDNVDENIVSDTNDTLDNIFSEQELNQLLSESVNAEKMSLMDKVERVKLNKPKKSKAKKKNGSIADDVDKKDMADFKNLIEEEKRISKLEKRQAKAEEKKALKDENRELRKQAKLAKKNPHVEAEKVKAKYSFRKYLVACLTLAFLSTTIFAVTNTTARQNIVSFFTDLFFSNGVGDAHAQQGDVSNYDSTIRNVSNNGVSNGDILSTTISDEQARLDAIAENSRVYCIISSSPYYTSATDKGSLYISNPKESVYYTQVVIKSIEDDKEMYVSPLLKPNEKIEYDYLTEKNFVKGRYPANAHFNYYSRIDDSGTDTDYVYIGTMCAEIVIVIGD